MANGTPETWQQFYLHNRRASYTTCYIFETVDSLRAKELRKFVEGMQFTRIGTEPTTTSGTRSRSRAHTIQADNNPQVALGDLTGQNSPYPPVKYLSDTWRGLSAYDLSDKTWNSVEPQAASETNPFAGIAGQQQANRVSFQDSIGMIDGSIRSRPTVAIFTGISNEDQAKALSIPLESWSEDDAIFDTKSTVFAVTPNAALFNEHTRRKCVVIETPFSTSTERSAIVNKTIRDFSGSNAELAKVDANGIVQQTSGMTMHDTESVLYESIYRKGTLESEFITKAKVKLIKSAGYDLVYPRYGWSALGGYPELRQWYERYLIQMLNDETARTWLLEPARGVIEFGPGGTGKSLRAKILAYVAHVPFIKVDASTIFGSLVGESERKVRQLIKVVEANAPCIVFIDEIDQLLLKRGSVMATDSGVQRRTQNQLMDWLGDDGRISIVIGATNRIQDIDKDSIRAGRFDNLVPVLLPDLQARKEIVRVHSQVIRKIPLAFNCTDSAEIAELADLTVLMSGAEIELAVKDAAKICLIDKRVKVTLQDMKNALSKHTVNIAERAKELNAFIKDAQTQRGADIELLNIQADRLNTEMTAYLSKHQELAAQTS